MHKSSRIYIAGHTGLIGSAIMRIFNQHGFDNVISFSHRELNLCDSIAVDSFFDSMKPEYVVLAAGKVGGITENQSYPADFININLAIQLNVLRAAQRNHVRKLILFGSSCMYPRECPQPMPETALFSGYPEPTSLAYAVSKLAGIQMCLAFNKQYGGGCFIPVIPNTAFGPKDNFDPKSGHVLPALIRRFHEAKQANAPSVMLWGSGNPRREFVYVDDIAHACLSLFEGDTSQLQFPLNLGTGKDYSIRELAKIIANIVQYSGEIDWDRSKPDGAPQKLLDSGKLLSYGWRPKIDFVTGLRLTYDWYLKHSQMSQV
jgi:GDP-L-fucose synthase